MLENLEKLIREIESHPKYKIYNGKFPNVSILAKSPEKHMPIIVEQAKRICSKDDAIEIAGFKEGSSDRDGLCKQFVEEIPLFCTENKIVIDYPVLASYGQQVITSNALFHLARSKEFRNTYQDIDLLCNTSAYESFSVPFTIRLAIENKLKSMIGFKSCCVTRRGETTEGTEFPVANVLNFLKKNNFLDSPCPLDEIHNIYSWSCRFTHLANREYIWLKLKALERLHVLFDYEANKKYESCNRLCYLKGEVTLKDLMKKINEDCRFKGHYELILTESEFAENVGFYSQNHSKYF